MNLSIDLHRLHKAKLILEDAGFIVTTAPLELWQHRNILNAWHPDLKEGFLIGPDELGLICHYGLAALNPHGFEQPRYKDSENPNRLKHYAEAVLSRAIFEIETASPGTSNAALNRSAFVIGRYLLGWQLDPDTVQGQLLEAALSRGIPESEAKAVVKAGLKAGSKSPRHPDELLDELVGKPSQSQNDVAAKHLAKLQRRMGGQR